MNWMIWTCILGAFVLSMALTRLMIYLGPKMGLIDAPGERRVHVIEIPRAGGIAVWLSFLVSYAIVLAVGGDVHSGDLNWKWYVAFFAGSLLLVIVGIADDKGSVRALVKLGFHVLAASVFYALFPVRTGLLPPSANVVWDMMIFVVWSVVLINSFNLIDGLDGLCGGLSLVSMLALAGLAWSGGRQDAAIVLLVMAGCIAGFLRYNFHPARIFLGDTGSMLMGFFLAAAATGAVGRKAVVGVMLLPIAVGGVPLLDVLLALWRRAMRKLTTGVEGKMQGGGLFSADREHLHHRMLDLSGSQRKVAFLMQGVAILLAVIAFLPMIFGDKMLALSLVGFFIVGLIGLKDLARIEIESTGNFVHLAIKARGQKRKVASLLYVYDFVVLALAGVAAVMVETNRFVRGADVTELVRFVLVYMIFGSVALLLAKIHRRLWSRATIRDLLSLQFWLFAAAVATFAVFSLVYRELEWRGLRVAIMTFTFSVIGVCFPRVILELMRSLGMEARHRYRSGKDIEKEGIGPVALIGGGDIGSLFLEHLKTSSSNAFKGMQVIGFLDDEPSMQGRRIRSIPVLGGLEKVNDLVTSHGLCGLVLTIHQPEDGLVLRVRELAGKHGLKIYHWGVFMDMIPLRGDDEEAEI